jgi:preprotein translocase subunit YajC
MNSDIIQSLIDASLLIGQEPPPPGGSMFSIFFLVLIFAGMWFLIIAPQRKRQKEHEAMVKALSTGDVVLTNGGIIGTITNVKEDRLVLKIADNTKVELHRNYVQSRLESRGES